MHAMQVRRRVQLVPRMHLHLRRAIDDASTCSRFPFLFPFPFPFLGVLAIHALSDDSECGFLGQRV